MKSSKSSNQHRNFQRNNEGFKVEQSRRFQEACALMNQNLQKFIGDSNQLESSDSEDELDSSIIQKTLKEYDGGGASDLMKTREFLQESITSGALVCLICIESIKRNDMIWSCHYCFCMLHLSCIQKWAKDSLFQLASTLEDEDDKKKNLKWCCPKCRYEYSPLEKPTIYTCFCGKVENPPFDPWIIPHSCGQCCEKKLKPFCGHSCTLLCHPGPCPSCPQSVKVSCYCMKSKPITKRCSNKEWSCNKPCEKKLPCQQHLCEEPCHKGECSPCPRQSQQKCNCGSETKLRPCNNPTWQCETICSKQLECGFHFCQIKCHDGPCPKCPKSGPRPCPCNKKIMWLPCTQEVVPCGDTCDKLLECELHRCTQRCHFGPCSKCVQMRVMKCRCGQRVKSVLCSKEYVCDIKCKRRRDCGRHNCNKKCCIGICPPCEAPCGRTLNCGSHKCNSRCHPGPCFPCRETVDITCNCGITKVTIPCGRKKSAVPPRCSADCKIPTNCDHPQRHKHKCHFDLCPPCRLTCEKKLECGHTCPAKCHSAVLTRIDTKEKKEGPWDLVNSYKMEFVRKPCPPCVIPVPVTCLGGHETANFPCSESKPLSCGRPCGRILSCENHFCKLECHRVNESQDSGLQSKNCQICEEPCTKQRKKGCTHPCRRECHPGDCDPCRLPLKMKCHCGINIMYIICDEWTSAEEEKRDELLCCKNKCPKEIPCGHRCTFLCHKGPCSTKENCKKKVTIRCACKRIKKEMQCFTFNEKILTLECDEICVEHQEIVKAQELERLEKMRAEEEKKQEQEVNNFLRKNEGKKKRKKKNIEVIDDRNFFKKNFIYICATLICISAILISTYLLNFVNYLN